MSHSLGITLDRSDHRIAETYTFFIDGNPTVTVTRSEPCHSGQAPEIAFSWQSSGPVNVEEAAAFQQAFDAALELGADINMDPRAGDDFMDRFTTPWCAPPRPTAAVALAPG